MKNRKVLFLGGNPGKFSSVQIRCEDVARRLECDCLYSARTAADVPGEYSAFICVKARLTQEEILQLAKRGPVIWDIVDLPPPRQGVSIYLASTERARQAFADYGRIEVIPHHHCNFSGVSNSQGSRRPGWIGTLHWRPVLEGFDYDVYSVRQMTAAQVAEAYRRIGIGLNLRAQRVGSALHVELNTGIKLINCIGFGIPSVSSDEPAYREIGEECTLFTDLERCANSVHQLQNDDQLYNRIRENCLRKASQFHISSIVKAYESLIAML